MSIWDEPLTKDEYSRRLFELKADRRRKDAQLPFEEKVEIVLALAGCVSHAPRGAGERAAAYRPSCRNGVASQVDRDTDDVPQDIIQRAVPPE